MSAQRRGITLVELMVVVTMSGVIFSAAAVCLHSMYRADQRVRQETLHRSAVSRLARQFRTDAHRAVAARQLDDNPADAQGLVFAGPSKRTIEYRVQDSEILRTVKDGEQVRHRDAFRLERGARVAWQIDDGPKPMAAVQIVRASPGGAASNGLQDRIEAAVGVIVGGSASPIRP